MGRRFIVAGAGPAGLIFALLAQGETTVLEDHARPGWPPHCTGLVSQATARRLARLAPGAIGEVYEAVSFRYGRREVLRLGGYGVMAARIRRPRLEEELWRRALERGVEIRLQARVRRIAREGCVHIRGGERICGDLVVASTGASQDALPSRHRLWRLQGVQAVVEAAHRPEEPVFQVVYHEEVSPEMFGWIVPLGGRKLLVGLASSRQAYGRLAGLLTLVDKVYGPLKLMYYYGGTVLRGPPRRKHVEGKVLYLGDAAGMVKPYTGGGLYAVSVTAPLAALLASKGAEGVYDTAVGWIKEQLTAQYRLTRLAYTLGPRGTAAALGSIRRAGLEDEVSRRVDYDSHEGLLRLLLPRVHRLLPGMTAGLIGF